MWCEANGKYDQRDQTLFQEETVFVLRKQIRHVSDNITELQKKKIWTCTSLHKMLHATNYFCPAAAKSVGTIINLNLQKNQPVVHLLWYSTTPSCVEEEMTHPLPAWAVDPRRPAQTRSRRSPQLRGSRRSVPPLPPPLLLGSLHYWKGSGSQPVAGKRETAESLKNKWQTEPSQQVNIQLSLCQTQ